MRCILIGIAVALGVSPLRAELPVLLREACLKASTDMEHWAYTETTVETDRNGHAQGATVVRVDPSKPYAEQFAPLQVNGRPPTERQSRQYRAKGERRGRKVEQAATEDRSGPSGTSPRVSVNGVGGVADFEHVTVVAEDAHSVTYEIPLRRDREDHLPLDKMLLWLRVDREHRVLENATIRVRSPFRVRVIARIKAGEIGLDFTTVDPRFPPPLTAVHADVAASVLFINVAAKVEMTRTDFRRVTPYDDRFKVQVGPLQFISY